MRSPLPPFAVATLAPVGLLLAGAVAGGAWTLAALVWMTALAAVLDEAVALVLPEGSDADFPAADTLSAVLAVGHLAVLYAAIWAIGSGALGAWEAAALFVAAGLCLGQVGNANAHELIHRGARGLRRLGVTVYVALLFGHHASAHPLVHHVHVATPRDPNSARLGEGYWRFAPRAWRGSFREGLRAETARLRRAGRPAWRHPYVAYVGGALAALGLSWALGGAAGVAVHVGLSAFAVSQLLMSDYVQHYGLARRVAANGRPEPVSARHSWNSPHWFTSALTLNATRHSDHHAHPGRPYPALRLEAEAPVLPRSLPAMACLALHPPSWRAAMDPRAARWRAAGSGPVAAE